jgi:hypothetical protein
MAIPPFGAPSGAKFPSQSGHAGQFLETNGSTVSWQPPFTQLVDSVGITLPANTSIYYSGYHEVSLGVFNEVALGAYEEVG